MRNIPLARLFLQTAFFKCKNKIIDSVLSENPLLHTDKADKKNHGKGISIVKSIAKKYGGDVVISEKNNEFTVTVILDNRIFTKNPLFLPD
ncbi:GHKL domain-containing protein [Ruminococcus bromii]|uniref:GHKL domain-containing protein n=1 Tax=Ruminococcus bromii TaxID=40518 RepID=UPI003C6E54CD